MHQCVLFLWFRRPRCRKPSDEAAEKLPSAVHPNYAWRSSAALVGDKFTMVLVTIWMPILGARKCNDRVIDLSLGRTAFILQHTLHVERISNKKPAKKHATLAMCILVNILNTFASLVCSVNASAIFATRASKPSFWYVASMRPAASAY